MARLPAGDTTGFCVALSRTAALRWRPGPACAGVCLQEALVSEPYKDAKACAKSCRLKEKTKNKAKNTEALDGEFLFVNMSACMYVCAYAYSVITHICT